VSMRRDPLIAVNGIRIGAAFRARDLSVREASKRLGALDAAVASQSLNLVVNGEQKSLRARVVGAICQLTGESWAWLTQINQVDDPWMAEAECRRRAFLKESKGRWDNMIDPQFWRASLNLDPLLPFDAAHATKHLIKAFEVFLDDRPCR
jgi:hypothetical protein